MGQLVFQATAGGQVALVGPNPSTSFSLNVPAINGTLITSGDTGTVTNTMLANSAIIFGSTSQALGSTVSALNGVSIGGTTASTGKFTSITNSGLTANQVVYAGTAGLESGSANMTFNGTTLTLANDASISGLTVGKGGGAVSTNTAVGASALGSNTTASDNTAVGYQAGYSNTTGAELTAIGWQSFKANTTANDNTGLGSYSGQANTTGADNTFIGFGAGYKNTTGSNNVALGSIALASNTTASYNTAIGYQTMANGTVTGNQNAAVGFQAGYFITSGQYNTCMGASSGNGTTTGSNNTYIGYNAYGSSATVSNELVLSSNAGAIGKGANTGYIQPNNGGVYQGNNSATWSITSDARLKKNIVDNTIGLSAITAIQVRNFEYRTKDEVTELEPQNAIEIAGVQLGAIAQELKEILPDCVKTESTGVMSVDTTNITWHLINAVKELNAKITALENK